MFINITPRSFKKMKLCVFQGTFNPIHMGHMANANNIKKCV